MERNVATIELFIEATRGWCLKAQRIWPAFKLPRIEIVEGLGSTAGMVHYDGRIRLNKFYCLANPEGMLENTIPHEVSHLLAYSIHSRQGQGHGKLWTDTFLLLKPGADITPCHNYGNVEAAKQKIQSVADQMLKELLSK
jgi:hypothetical protein